MLQLAGSSGGTWKAMSDTSPNTRDHCEIFFKGVAQVDNLVPTAALPEDDEATKWTKRRQFWLSAAWDERGHCLASWARGSGCRRAGHLPGAAAPMEDDCLASTPRGLDCRHKPVTFPEPVDDSARRKERGPLPGTTVPMDDVYVPPDHREADPWTTFARYPRTTRTLTGVAQVDNLVPTAALLRMSMLQKGRRDESSGSRLRGTNEDTAWLLGRGALVAAEPATCPELRPSMEDDCLASTPRGLDCRHKPVTFPEPVDDSARRKERGPLPGTTVPWTTFTCRQTIGKQTHGRRLRATRGLPGH
ncbi:hypothetical protein HPB47_007608 [Ixodes persulcatus]|uniref:Uncharacterized protein n=1 Tax=Ixodes persulcatus TaxID=34615 RepID=A0AC60P7T7_IXOPE|nr:hypothetical protein HPB47_007608 [Ixodes persulcatus]